MAMTSINLLDIINTKSAISPRAGLKAYDYVANLLPDTDSLSISFASIEDLTSAFCNSFIGKLYMNFDPSLLDEKIKFTYLDQDKIWAKKVANAILLGSNENVRTLHKQNLDEVIFS